MIFHDRWRCIHFVHVWLGFNICRWCGICRCVLLWVAGPSRVDITSMLMEALEVTGMSLTSTSHERQSATLLWAPDIHSRVIYIWQVPVTICLLCCLHFYHSETSVGACGHCIQECKIPAGSKCHRLPVQ